MYMNFFDHKDLGNHLLQLCPKVVKHPVVLRGRWCNIVLNVHAMSEEKSDDSRDSFYKELEQVFDHFP